MITMRVAAFAACASLLGAAGAEIGTQTVSANIPFTGLNWTQNLDLPKFNGFGHLDSVQISFSGAAKGSMAFENRDIEETSYSASLSYLLVLKNEAGSTLLSVSPKPIYTVSGDLTAFDGQLDYAGTSGVTHPERTASESKTITLTAPADIAAYQGIGNVSLPVAASSNSNVSGSGNFDKVIRNSAGADIKVTYTYSFERGSLGDKVFVDANSNGLQDSGELGKSGVKVDLIDAAGNTIASTTTDSNGLYLFSGLMPGEYQVKFTAPAGTQFTTANVGNDAQDSDAGVGGLTDKVIVHSGENVTTVDAGLVGLQSLGDRVWLDTNANGLQDAGEPGLTGVGVTLLDGNGNIVGTTQTGDNGIYAFTGLFPGSYKVKFDDVLNYDRTVALAGDSTKDSDAGANGVTSTISLNAGDQRTDIDAGYCGTVNLGDRVWFDANANGKQDDGERGIPGVSVSLTDANGNVIGAPQLTDANGNYLFTDLKPGNYRIKVTRPSGYAFSGANAGTDEAIDSDVDGSGLSGVVSLTADNLNVDAGLYGSLCLGDRVWRDDDKDGLQDSCEPGVAGVVVRLLDTNGNTIAQTVTDTNGYYKFVNLAPGDYSVDFDAPAGYGFTKQFANAQYKQYDSNVDPASGVATVTLAANDSTIDAGLIGAFKIGDTVWLDSDGDGKYEPEIGEKGLGNVTMTLYGDTNNDGRVDVTAQVNTDANGKYLFNSLAPGKYAVYVDSRDLPYGVIASYDLDGTGTLNVATGNVSMDNLNFDFGYRLKCYPGVGTPGYWKNHPCDWPVDTLTIGGKTYTRSQAISIIGTSTRGDYTYIMYRAVACAKLNVASGNSASMIVRVNGKNVSVEDLIRQGDAWLAKYPVGSKPSEAAWNLVSAIATAIDNYNNGQYGIPHR